MLNQRDETNGVDFSLQPPVLLVHLHSYQMCFAPYAVSGWSCPFGSGVTMSPPEGLAEIRQWYSSGMPLFMYLKVKLNS